MSAEEHSPLGASGANCWLNCAGSYLAQKDLLDKDSAFAHEGTCGHELAELCLANKTTTRKWIGKPLIINTDWIVDAEMADYIQSYVDYVRSINGYQEYEQKVSYAKWVPDGFGTADAIATVDDILYVIDLKYGKGIKVDADENPQGMLYALGALDERSAFQDFKKVVIVIYQPRLDHVSEWKTTPAHLYEFAEFAKKRAALCLEPNAVRTPGEKQCQWCKAKPTCPALLKQTETALMQDFASFDETLPEPSDLTPEQIKTVMDHKGMIEKWLKSIESHVIGEIENGNGFPGWKMVEGRSNRKWRNELEAEKVLRSQLGDEAYVKKILSVAQAEKALGKGGKDYVKDFVSKPPGKPVLVPENDKRPAIAGITAEYFD